MADPTTIAGAVKEIFGFLREWNNADQRQKRYALSRVKKIQQAANTAEQIFVVVDDMLDIAREKKLFDNAKFRTLEKKYRQLVEKFNELD